MAGELRGAKRWIYERLTGDATLAALIGSRVFPDVAPLGTPPPYLIFSLLAARDRNGLGGARLFTRPLYVVKAVGIDGYEALDAIYDRADVVLIDAPPALVDGVIVMSCRREQPFSYPTVDDDNTVYQHLGGNYRLQCQRN